MPGSIGSTTPSLLPFSMTGSFSVLFSRFLLNGILGVEGDVRSGTLVLPHRLLTTSSAVILGDTRDGRLTLRQALLLQAPRSAVVVPSTADAFAQPQCWSRTQIAPPPAASWYQSSTVRGER